MKPLKVFATLLVAFAVGCVGGGAPDDEFENLENEPPLSDLEDVIGGAPKADELERLERKSDEILPPRFTELVSTMSPVKSQGKRGVCSIFASVGQMEHLYFSAGYEGLDFSEQYLQWSGKFQVRLFRETEGHSGKANLQAIHRFGVVEESFWPYESARWDDSDDRACTGDSSQPTRCYTNGFPPEEAVGAPKYKLPGGRYLHPEDLKAHLLDTQTAATVGLDFFYQSWNHGASELPINKANWRRGMVMAPNTADRRISASKRVGHAILVIGWDDEMEAQRLDRSGELLFDRNGDPLMERGFYLFKNSWGADSFGVDNEQGGGYGWISQAYIHEFGRVSIAGRPRAQDLPGLPAREFCDDGVDNDGNGKIDCSDEACVDEEICSSGKIVVSNYQTLEIPDFNGSSVRFLSSSIEMDAEGRVEELTVTVNISHDYISDLEVSLRKGNTTAILYDRGDRREDRGTDNLRKSFVVTDFAGERIRGTWELWVGDFASRDSGFLNGWSLEMTAAEE